jgi:hypothetical protein
MQGKRANVMKKNKIRLTLNRETLRNLAADETSNAQGGVIVQLTQSCFQTYCVCITQTCPTKCGQTYCYYV